MTERENLDRITESIIGAAIEVHHALGLGLLELLFTAERLRHRYGVVDSRGWFCLWYSLLTLRLGGEKICSMLRL